MEEKKRKTTMKLKELLRAQGPAEAEVVKTLLESYGISSVFRGKVVQSVHPFSADGLGEIKILVSEKDYELAVKLLEKKENNLSS